MRRLEPGDVPWSITGLQWAEAKKGMQMMGLTTDCLDAPMQFAAIDVADHSRTRIALGDPPEHAIQQAPALLGAIARGHFEFVQQLSGDANARSAFR